MLQRGDRRIKKTESVADFFRRGDSDGRGSRSCSSETRLRQAVLFNVSSVFRLFFRRLISVVLLLLLIVPLYFTVYYLPAAFLLVFFKGYTFGIVTVILLSTYGIGGFFIFLICALPTALLTFALLAIACTLGGEICKKRPPACGNGGIFCSFLLLLIGATACALAEILLVTIIFRPVSKIF